MKTSIKKLLLVGLISIASVCTVFADDPDAPPDPGGDPGTGGGTPVGAPIGGGLGVLFVIGAAYGGYTLIRSKKEKPEKQEELSE